MRLPPQIVLSLLFLLVYGELLSQPFVSGQTYYGENDYIEYKAGNLPIIIAAPHGGTIEPANIPDRNCSGCVTVRDRNTEELARNLYEEIFEVFGCYPHVVINLLHRRKLDANREIVEAANGNALAEQSWDDFHYFIQSAKDSALKQYGRGLFLDLHGHGHTIQRLELGYLLSKSELQLSDMEVDDLKDEASIRALATVNLESADLSELLRGIFSFGELYENALIPAVPSLTDPYPLSSEAYFSGGYNTARHGSREGGMIDGIQIECNYTGVRDTEGNRLAFAIETAKLLKTYMETFYFGPEFWLPDCGSSTSVEPASSNPFQWYVHSESAELQVDLSQLPPAWFPLELNLYNLHGGLMVRKKIDRPVPVPIPGHSFPMGMYMARIHPQITADFKAFDTSFFTHRWLKLY